MAVETALPTETKPATTHVVEEGIYRLKVNLEPDDLYSFLYGLNLDFYAKRGPTLSKSDVVCQLINIHKVHSSLKSTTRLSRICTLLGFSKDDVTKLFTDGMFGRERVEEYWEVTQKQNDILDMGNSDHFTSCYAYGGHYSEKPKYLYGYGGVSLVRKLDARGDLRSRFCLFRAKKLSHVTDTGNWPGQDLRNIEDTNRYDVGGKVCVANHQGVLFAKAIVLGTALWKGEAEKLTEEELKDFVWK